MFKSRLKRLPVIISFFGKMGSGKDTAGEIARKFGEFERMAFGDELKKVVDQKYSNFILQAEPEERGERRRRLLQLEGQNSREVYPDVWVDWFDRKLYTKHAAYESFKEVYNRTADNKITEPLKIVVTDMRQPNEYEYLKSLNAVMVKIVADDWTRRERIENRDGFYPSDPTFYHETESFIDEFDYDFIVYNNGSKQEFTNEVYELVRLFRK